jgi:geranylgeranyl diphosphate synthase type II
LFSEIFKSELKLIDMHLRSIFARHEPVKELDRLWESMTYSVFSEGKRFRPLLSVLTAKALNRPPEQVLPLASAVELIHTYSLIHDDLPCMDDDDFRRGQPTNHRVFGEANALLAGDGLLTMAFGILAQSPSPRAAQAVALLSEAAGPRGMVGGQVMDIEATEPGKLLLEDIHKRKTGRLIQVSVEGAGVLCEAPLQKLEGLRTYGEQLGLAFQLADDIQDFDPEEPEKVSFASLLGNDETLKLLNVTSQKAIDAIAGLDSGADGLREMIRLNRERV